MANASQFIGSKISLISKAEIRYEGILYSLDLQEATISLAKVRSFGTEDRPTEKPVPPKDEVYEFIIFRGSDIKGIDVIEPPKAAPSISGGLPNDPAIVEVSHYHTAAQHQQQQQHYSHRDALPFGAATTIMGKPTHSEFSLSPPKGDSSAGGSSLPPYAPIPSSHQQNQDHSNINDLDRPSSAHDTSRSNVSTPSAYGSSRKSPTNEAGTQANRNRQDGRRQRGGQRGGQQQQQMSPQQNRQQNNQNNMQQQQRRGQNNNNQQGFMQRGGRGNYNNNRGQQMGGGGGYQGQQMRGGRGQSRGPRGNRTPGVFQVPENVKVKFDEAFDFEKANAELETALSKLKLEKTNSGDKKDEVVNGEGGSTEQDEQENKEPEVYYQKDDFFDKISCEASERSKGKVTRVDWKAEKKLNVETFGASANGPRYGYRGGFGYRGRGGYGGGNNYGYGNNYRGGNGGYQPRYGGYNSYNRFGSGGGGRGGGLNTGNNRQQQQ